MPGRELSRPGFFFAPISQRRETHKSVTKFFQTLNCSFEITDIILGIVEETRATIAYDEISLRIGDDIGRSARWNCEKRLRRDSSQSIGKDLGIVDIPNDIGKILADVPG